MKRSRVALIGGIIIGMLCVMAGLVTVKQNASKGSPSQAESTQAEQQMVGPEARSLETGTRDMEPVQTDETRRTPGSSKRSSQATSKAPGTAAESNSVSKTKPPLKDPVARVALAWVGMDEGAEAYWYGAINVPENVPAAIA